VAEAVLLLVGRIVLLVDDDQAEARDRREEGGAGADDRPGLAAPDAPPLRPSLARPERAVQHGDRVAQAAADAIEQLMRERDLRNEEERAPAAAERVLRGGEEHLGLAAARDAMQEEG